MKRRLLAALVAGLYVPAQLVATAGAGESADCFDQSVPLTVEERRLSAGTNPVGQRLVRAGGFDRLVGDFRSALCATGSAADARQVVARSGEQLWRTAVDRAQGRRPGMGTLDPYDDRPLYWARLQMSSALRQWSPESEIRAVVRYPRRLPAGKVPLIILLHGQNIACETDGEQSWPCPPGVRVFPSYRGYDYLGAALARRGFVVVSLSANGINHQVGTAPQRARLINRHLAMWQELSATGAGPLAGRFTDAATGGKARVDFRGHVDLTRVGTMGHSVAGEAVMMQASDKHRGEWPRGVRIGAVVPIASRYFEVVEGDNSNVLITTIPFAVVSATCWDTTVTGSTSTMRGAATPCRPT